MFYLIYKITNLLNGMIYIGKHHTTDINDSYLGSSAWLNASIKKHGIENFKKEILFIFDNETDMNNKERELVNKEFVDRKDTYNLNEGGSGSWYACNKNGQNNKVNQYKICWEKCLKDPEYKRNYCDKISKGLIRHKQLHPEFNVVKNNGMFSKKHTNESKQIMSEKHLGPRNSMYGKMWITNPVLKENKIHEKDKPIPDGWVKGRKFYT